MFDKRKKISPKVHEMSASGNRFGGNGFKELISKPGLEKWKPVAGQNRIDIIPYNATKTHPLVITGQIDEGDALYSLDIMVHPNMGPAQNTLLCLRQYGRRCPICEECSRLMNLGTEEGKADSGKMYARRRIIYLVHDLNTGKFGWWNTGYKAVEQKIYSAASFEMDENGNKIDVFDWEEGKTLRFMGQESSFNGHKYVEADGFGFLPRRPLSEEVLSQSDDLSKYLTLTSEEEMERLLTGELPSKAAPASSSNIENVPRAVPEPPADAYGPQPEQDTMAMPPVEEKTTQAPAAPIAPANSCPCGHKWGGCDQHDECSSCPTDIWERCLGSSGE